MVGFLIFLGVLLGAGLLLAGSYIYKLGIQEGEDKVEPLVESLRWNGEAWERNYNELKSDYEKLLGQKKSSEVRTGLIAEQMAPFLEGFPYDSKCARHLGMPIDFIVFDDTGIHFVEVKSGNAQLTKEQRAIKDHIDNGRITFEVYRVRGRDGE